jgi:hypothetical protein
MLERERNLVEGLVGRRTRFTDLAELLVKCVQCRIAADPEVGSVRECLFDLCRFSADLGKRGPDRQEPISDLARGTGRDLLAADKLLEQPGAIQAERDVETADVAGAGARRCSPLLIHCLSLSADRRGDRCLGLSPSTSHRLAA